MGFVHVKANHLIENIQREGFSDGQNLAVRSDEGVLAF
jgi:hypothetical protein